MSFRTFGERNSPICSISCKSITFIPYNGLLQLCNVPLEILAESAQTDILYESPSHQQEKKSVRRHCKRTEMQGKAQQMVQYLRLFPFLCLLRVATLMGSQVGTGQVESIYFHVISTFDPKTGRTFIILCFCYYQKAFLKEIEEDSYHSFKDVLHCMHVVLLVGVKCCYWLV